MYYGNGCTVSLLNNTITDEIILKNYIEHSRINPESRNNFILKKPEYIINDDNDIDPEKRTKTIADRNNIQLEISQEIGQQTQAQTQTQAQQENEQDIDLDKEQLENKLNRKEAKDFAEFLPAQRFFEEYQDDIKIYDSISTNEIVKNMFNSFAQMSFVTRQALEFIIKHHYLFINGINPNNLPIGLAYKNGILFLSPHRLTSMPINGFTIKSDIVRSYSSNPIMYSWLHFATKSLISLNDIYDSNMAPKLYDRASHSAIKDFELKDENGGHYLDKPFNRYHMAYHHNKDTYATNYSHSGNDNIKLDFFGSISDSTKQTFYAKFPNIYFHKLSTSDFKILDNIYENLKKENCTISCPNS